MSVSGQTQREINTLLKKQTQEGGALRVVAARPVDGRSEEANRLLNQSQCNTCVYIYMYPTSGFAVTVIVAPSFPSLFPTTISHSCHHTCV